MIQLVGNTVSAPKILGASKLKLNIYGDFGSGQVQIQLKSADGAAYIAYPDLTFDQNTLKVIELPSGTEWRAESVGGVVSVNVHGF